MPPVNAIAAVQEKYAALAAWPTKPADLWFGPAWPRRADGSLVSVPLVRFLHQSGEIEPTFAHQASERWRFRFEVYDTSPPAALAHFYGLMYGGAAPSQRAGFFAPAAFPVPTDYVFKHFVVTDPFVTEDLEGQFSPTGSHLTRIAWGQELWLHRRE